MSAAEFVEFLEFSGTFSVVAKFILDNGKEFSVGPYTFVGKRKKPNNCFGNAALMALADERLLYVEGYVTCRGIPIHHAWNVDLDGKLIDPTLTGGLHHYFGVVFTTDYLKKAVLKNGYYGSLLDIMYAKTLPALIAGKAKTALAKHPASTTLSSGQSSQI